MAATPFILGAKIGCLFLFFVENIHFERGRQTGEAVWLIVFLSPGPRSSSLLGQDSISLPRPVCLQGLRPLFIPCSAAKVDTPPRHEDRGMHPDPPPSSFPTEEQRWRPLYGKQPRPQALHPSVFHPPLYLLTLLLFFSPSLPLCRACMEW